MTGWFFRLIARFPHPGYGACGGAWQDCSQSPDKPKDDMDRAFYEHDADLFYANLQTDPVLRDSLILGANKTLGTNLRKIDPKTLGWYGRAYRRLAMLVFWP